MEDLQEELLHPNIEQVLQLDLRSKKQVNIRTLLAFLAQNQHREVSSAEIEELLNLDKASACGVIRRLRALSDTHSESYGFKIVESKSGKFGAKSYRLEIIGDAKERKRGLGRTLRTPELIPITDRMRKKVSMLIGGIELRESLPENYTSLIHNTRILRPEEKEVDYVMALSTAAEKGMAVRTDTIKIKLDIPVENRRLRDNLAFETVNMALELGFVIDSVQQGYQAIFFLDADQRGSKGLSEKGLEDNNPCFDDVEPFDLETSNKRVYNTRRQFLNPKQKALVRFIAEAQSDNRYLKVDDLIKTGIVEDRNQFDYIQRKMKTNRFKLGFYIRVRADGAVFCTLLKQQ